MDQTEKTGVEIKNEILAMMGRMPVHDSAEYFFICTVADRLHGPNPKACEAVQLIAPTLEKIRRLRAQLKAEEKTLRDTLKRLQKKWLKGQ